MKTFCLRGAATIAAAACLAAPALAADYGTIVSKTTVLTPVSVPQQQCASQQQLVQQPRSGAGVVVGGLAGGLLGHTVGKGGGRVAATGLGAVAGALVGDRLEAGTKAPMSTTVQQCQTVMQTENRVTAYDVVYDYRAQRFSARVANDPGNPGDRIALNVNITPVAPPPSI